MPKPLQVRKLALWVPGCENGRHIHHPDLTCDEADAWADASDAFFVSQGRTDMRDVPPSLRGPRWTPDA